MAITVAAEELVLLTPLERWHATRQLNTNSGFAGSPWFSTVVLGVLIALGVLFLAVSLHRAVSRLRAAERAFADYTRRKGLTEREAEMVLAISIKAGLKYSAAVFMDGGIFDRGAAGLIEAGIRAGDSDERNRQLRAELARLREKLGYRTRSVSSIGQVSRNNGISSRQIAAGKEVRLTGTTAADNRPFDVKCAVIESDDIEMTVKPHSPVRIAAGQYCTVRYESGASYWEFGAAVIGCRDTMITLSQSDDVRLINRRLFKRVSLNAPACITLFPFTRNIVVTIAAGAQPGAEQSPGSNVIQAVPQFTAAVVTEVAGTRLVVQTKLDVKSGDRMMILFEVGDKAEVPGAAASSRVIEDIGFVRYARAVGDGSSATVEMTGLSEADLSELMRLTGSVRLETGALTQRTEQSKQSAASTIAKG